MTGRPQMYQVCNRVAAGITRRIRKRWLRRRIRGVPDGLSVELVDDLCRRLWNHRPCRITHTHLSGWKSSGAHRIWLEFDQGETRTLIYKDAVYRVSQIPALAGFPTMPGRPEFLIYRRPGGGVLSTFLPTVHWIEEVEEYRHYRYLMEDLSGSYRTSFDDDALRSAAGQIPTLHHALAEWAAGSDAEGLLWYDRSFSSAIRDYALCNLEEYSRRTDDSHVALTCRLWPKIAQVHARRDLVEQCSPSFIHGDFNSANVLTSWARSGALKVVDWEWAGRGLPHSDLAALLKRAEPYVEQEAVVLFARQDTRFSLEQHRRLYRWCQLERCMIDAAFFSAQALRSKPDTLMNLGRSTSSSAQRLLRYYWELL